MSKPEQEPLMESQELSEDIEIVGPGQMLAEGRKAMSLSQEEVAQRLNFRLTLVKDIENEKFDKSLPATFNRGYLRNFAKLVNVSIDDVLASYEMLNVAEKQSAEMQSFSKRTKRQTENSILKWLTYLIVGLVLGSTLVWYFQESSTSSISSLSEAASENNSASEMVEQQTTATSSEQADTEVNTSELFNSQSATEDEAQTDLSQENNEALVSSTSEKQVTNQVKQQASAKAELAVMKTPATFYFSGDCWVNIYDATGERIAWGVKKADYVMQIEGVAPLTVTLGKPELVAINFNGNDVDMTQFTQGNIAKFTLPLVN